MTPAAAFALAACLAVAPASDRITLGDLVPAFPGSEIHTPETPVAYAPAPGVERVFRISELRRLAARFGLEAAPAGEICFQRPLAPLDGALLVQAMQRALPEARISLLDYGRLPVPAGELEFAVSGLRQTPAGALWTGSIRYAGGRRFPVWAKVRVAVRASRVIAAADLEPGRRLEASQLRVEESELFPTPDTFAASIAQVTGKVLRRTVRAGTPLRTGWLEAAKEVNRGDTVRVEVQSGHARLVLEAQAEAAGATGESIPVRNPASNRRFRARVEGKGRVTVSL